MTITDLQIKQQWASDGMSFQNVNDLYTQSLCAIEDYYSF